MQLATDLRGWLRDVWIPGVQCLPAWPESIVALRPARGCLADSLIRFPICLVRAMFLPTPTLVSLFVMYHYRLMGPPRPPVCCNPVTSLLFFLLLKLLLFDPQEPV